MDPKLWDLLEGNQDEDVAAIVRLVPRTEPPAGLRVVARFGDIATCRIARGQLVAVREHPSVRSLKAARALTAEPAFSLDTTQHPPKRRRRSLPDVTGRGVVVGVIDWGCDFTHPNFLRRDGSTRLLAIWDQRGRSTRSPQPYDYGCVHDAAAIDAALASDDPFAALRYDPADADVDENGTHGTHVLDIAAGTPAIGPGGVAPGADLAFVHLSQLDRGPRNIANSVTLLEAIDFIAKLAGTRPWVINMSLGSHAGPHDGSTPVELALDAAVASGGVIVQSVGNYYRRPIHSTGRMQQGERITIDWEIDPTDETRNELDIWYAGSDRITVRLQTPDGRTLVTAPPDSHGTIRWRGRDVGRYGHRTHDPNNGDNQVTLIIDPIIGGTWRVAIDPQVVERGHYHAWIERDESTRGSQSRLARAHLSHATTTNSISNGHKTITVGAYDPRSGELTPFSSMGPTRDGRAKPDLVAPGYRIVAARSSDIDGDAGDLTTKSGTSMAAPHVTGTVALMLEAARGKLTIDEVRDLLMRTAKPVAGVDAKRAGWGCLDTRAAVAAARALKRGTKAELAWLADASGVAWAGNGARVFDTLLRGTPHRLALAPFAEVVARPGEVGNVRAGDIQIRRAYGEAHIARVERVGDPAKQRAALDRLVLRPRKQIDRAIGLVKAPARPARGGLREDVAPAAYLDKPAAITVSVDRMGLVARAAPEVKYAAGDRFTQAASMLVRALVGPAYAPQLVGDLIAATGLGPTPGMEGAAKADEPVGRFSVVSALFGLEILAWLKETRKLQVYLDDAMLVRLHQAATVESAWKLATEDASLGVRVYGWVDRTMFTHIAWHEPVLVENLRRAATGSAEARSAAVALWQRFNEAAEPLDLIRSDSNLTAHAMYRILWQLGDLAKGQAGGPTVAETTRPNSRVMMRALEVCLVRWHGDAQRAKGSSGERKKLLDRMLEDLAIIAQTSIAVDEGDDPFGNTLGKANAPPFPSRITVNPPLEPPLLAMPAHSELACEYHVDFGDVFDAFGAQYIWQLQKLDDGSFRDVDGAGLGTLLGTRLDRQMEYTGTDFLRLQKAIEDRLGDPGIGAATIAGALAIIRSLGTVIGTFFEALTQDPWERTIALGGPGFYMIKAIAQQSSSDGPLVRVPSAAYRLVFVQPADKLASTYVDLEYARLGNMKVELDELTALLAAGLVPEDQRADVEAAIAAYQVEVGGDVGAILARQLDAFRGEREKLAKRNDFEIDREEAKKQIDARIKELKNLVDTRASHIADVADKPRFRFLAVLVTDRGPTMRLMVEAVHMATAADAKVTYRVINTTVKKSSRFDGSGKTPADAIAAALLACLEDADHGYGRGYCSIIIPARPDLGIIVVQKATYRVDLDIGSILTELIEGSTLIISIIAILAAPFTGGASLSLLIPLGVIGIIPSAYRIANRVRHGTFDWDLETALDLVNVVGGLIGLGQMGAGALKMVRLAKGFMILGHGSDGLGILLGNEQFLREIEAIGNDPSMTPAQKRAALMGVVANKLAGDGIAVGSTLGRRARHEMDLHNLDPSRFPIDEGPPLPAEANVKPPDASRIAVDPQLVPVDAKLLAQAQKQAGKRIVVLRDSRLKGRGAEVRYRLDRLGFVDEVYVVLGKDAGASELKVHAATAKQMLKFTGLIGKARTLIDRARALLRSRPDLKVGDPAWEARLELEKLPRALTEYMDAAPARLRKKELTPAQVDAYIAGIREQLAVQEERLRSASGPRRGAIAAHDDGADARAVRRARLAGEAAPLLGADKATVTVRDAPAGQEHISVQPTETGYDITIPAQATDDAVHAAARDHADLARRRPLDPKVSLDSPGPEGKRAQWTAKEEARYRGYADEPPGYKWAFKDGELVLEGEPKRHYDPAKGKFEDGDAPHPAPKRAAPRTDVLAPPRDAPAPKPKPKPDVPPPSVAWPLGKKPRQATPTYYHWYAHGQETGCAIKATFDNGVLEVTIRSGKGKPRRGHELLDDVFRHFGADNIHTFKARWVRHKPFNANYNEYIANLAKPMTPEQAARETWTGRQLEARGFTKVEIPSHGDKPAEVNPVFRK